MGAPFHLGTHVSDGLAKLISQYKDKPRLAAWISSYLDRVQELEDAIWSVLIGRLIDTAVGVQLDVLGSLVGQLRGAFDDEGYRILIRARIRANRSTGSPTDIQSVVRLALDSDAFTYTELYPATVVIELPAPTEYASVFLDLLLAAKAEGVALTLRFSEDPLEETFAFSDSDDAQDDAARGFSDDDPTTGPGGKWIGAF